MPIYEFEHIGKPCLAGKQFDCWQSMDEKPLSLCPECGGAVKKLISLVSVNTPKTNSEIRDAGFTKLVRRDDGVYENVTARKGESKLMERGKPETMPNIKKIISD